jgi:phosphoglycolate phosphatase-like HAD superfamily hydrolase
MNEGPPVLYLDLDGTLLDVREKYQRLHRRIAADLGRQALSWDTFWARKRRGATLEGLLPDWEEAARQEYAKRWLEEIESPLYTRFDWLVPGARHSLVRLGREFELVLVTLRRDGRELRRQLRHLGLDQLFRRLLVSGDHGGVELTKAQLLSLALPPEKRRSIVVGDSEEDVWAARAMRSPVIAVLTGMRDRAFLAALNPDLIIESVAQLPAALQFALPSPAAGSRGSLKVGLP